MATFKRRHPPPKQLKTYSPYRDRVREDFNGYCAYCGVHDSEWPHTDKNYQIDHFKPKDEGKFPELKNDFYNLRWCCHICNRKDAKGNVWPTLEDEKQGDCFVDLCEDDWTKHYEIQKDGHFKPLTSQAEYTIEVIGLNDDEYVKHRLSIIAAGRTLFQAPDEV